MTFGEIHFNSAVGSLANGTPPVLYGGNRSRRILNFNDPVRLDGFLVKNVQVPRMQTNIPAAGTVTFTTFYLDVNAAPIGEAYWEMNVPAGYYSSSSLIAAITPSGAPVLGGTAANPPVLGGLTVGISTSTTTSEYLRITYTTDGTFFTAPIADPFYVIQIEISENLRHVFGIGAGEPLEYYTSPIANAAGGQLILNKVPTLTFSCYYLHSNLTTGTPLYSTNRAVGLAGSKSVVARVPLDSIYIVGQMVFWQNAAVDPAFMYPCRGEYNQLEFWFTDEFGNEIDFQGNNFSLTLCVFYQ